MPAIGVGSGSEAGEKRGRRKVKRAVRQVAREAAQVAAPAAKHPRKAVAKAVTQGATRATQVTVKAQKTQAERRRVRRQYKGYVRQGGQTKLSGITKREQATFAAQEKAGLTHKQGPAIGHLGIRRVVGKPSTGLQIIRALTGDQPGATSPTLGEIANVAATVAPIEGAAAVLARAGKAAKDVREAGATVKAAREAETAAKVKPHSPEWLDEHLKRVRTPEPKPEPKVEPKRLVKTKPKREPILRRVRRYREERVPLRERPGKIGKVARQRRKVLGAAAVAPVAVSPAQGIHGKGPGFGAVKAAGSAVQGALPGPLGAAARDAVEFPAQTIPVTYTLVHAGVKAAGGDPSEAKAVWESYKKTGFLPKVVAGNLSGAASTFEKHPLFSALEVASVYGGAGRALGAAARHAPVEALRKAAGTERAPAKVAEGIEIQRDYSKNPVTKAAQVARERHRAKRGKPVVSETKANKYLKKRLNYHVGKGHARGRRFKEQTIKRMLKQEPARAPGVRNARAADVVSFIAQRAIRKPETWKQDIGKLIKTYKDARKSGELTKPEIDANHRNVEVLREAENMSPREIRRAFQAAEHYVAEEHSTRAALVEQGHYHPAQTEQASLYPYAQLHMGAKYGISSETKAEMASLEREVAKASGAERDRLRGQLKRLGGHEQLIGKDGNALSTAGIHAHMERDVGSKHAGFVTHRPHPRNPFFVGAAERPQVPRAARTGKAFMRGTHDSSYVALVEHLVRSRGITNATQTFDGVGAQFGARRIGGERPQFFKTADATRLAIGDPERFKLKLAPGERYVPFRITPAYPKASEIQAIHDLTPEEEHVLSDLESRLSGGGKGTFVAIPQSVANLLRQHYRVPTKFEKAMQVGTTQFKSTVLPTSPSFFAGNALDNYIVRPVVGNVGPLSYVFGRRLLRKITVHDPELADEVRMQFLRGTLYGSAKTERIRRTATDFDSRTVNALAALLRAPGIGSVRKAWNVYRSGILEANARMEAQPQIAGFGKLARGELRAAGNGWLSTMRLQQRVVEDFTKRISNPDHEVRFAQGMWDLWGKWDDWSPSTRYLLQTYSPFGSWLFNASKLAIWTLPTKHPVKAGLIAAMEQATSGQREAEGKSLFAAKPLPGFLQGGIPWGPGGKGILGVSHFSSFGIFDDPAQTLSGAVLPQFSSGLKALIGIKWTGQQLVDAKGNPLTLEERFAAAANSTVEAFVPLASWLRRAREGGPSADTSTILHPQAKKVAPQYRDQYKGGLTLLNPFTYYDPAYVKYLREPKKTVTYPAKPAGTSAFGGGDAFSGGDAFKGGGSVFK